MRRRGFLGTLAAAIAAHKLTPTAEAAVLKPSGPPPMMASGVFHMDYEHRGFSIMERDGSVQHLGENGHLVAFSYPDGKTTIINRDDVTVRRSFNHPDMDDHTQPFVDKSRL